MSDLEVHASDGALWLTLNRPEVFNALTGEMADEIAEVIEGATAREDVRVIAVTGTGPAFSTGADISGAEAHEGFEGRAPGDVGLSDWLKSHEVTDLDLCGIATDYCVRATALDALAEGFNVRVLADLCAGIAEDTSRGALEEMRQAGATVV